MELEKIIKKDAKAFDGKVAYLYCDMEKYDKILSFHAKDQVVSASVIKVPIMMAVLDRALREHLSLESKIKVDEKHICADSLVFEYGERQASLYELLFFMIVNSDNTATNVLIEYMGMDALNLYFEQIGLKTTRVERKMLDYKAVKSGKNNYISAKDIYTSMTALLKQTVLNQEYCELALNIMKKNRDNKLLNRYLYEGYEIAHKTGGLNDIVHDAGVIYGKNGKYFLAVLVSEFKPSKKQRNEAKKLIGRISRVVADCENEKDI